MAEAGDTKAAGVGPAPPGLSAEALRLLASLDDGFPAQDSAGRPLSGLCDRDMGLLDGLTARRLCRLLPGWDESWWALLTPRGRALLAAAEADARTG